MATELVAALTRRTREWGSRRIYLTSEPDNAAAHATWLRLGFVNMPGAFVVDGIQVTADFKGPGKHRAVYELRL